MPKIRLLFLAALAIVMNACSDNSSSPDDGSNNGSNAFAIVAIDEDTVYWNEPVTVTFKNASSGDLTAYIHTTPVTIDSIWRDASGNGGMRFHADLNTPSGSLGLYIGDTLLAANPPVMVILEQDFSKLRPGNVRTYPASAYVGDIIRLVGADLPVRSKDISVKQGTLEFPIVAMNSPSVLVRVPSGAVTGDLTVRMFDTTAIIRSPKIVEAQGQLLPEGLVKFIDVQVILLNGDWSSTTIVGADTVREESTMMEVTSLNQHFYLSTNLSTGDSLIFFSEVEDAAGYHTLEVRLKPEPENRVSGTIRVTNEGQIQSYSLEIGVKNIRWRYEEGEYKLYSLSTDITGQLTEFRLSNRKGPTDNLEIEQFNYTGANLGSEIAIRLAP